jgi:molybdopterin-guanine dinucleotide biosynthesis protein A
MLGAVVIVQSAGQVRPNSVHRATTALDSVCDSVLIFGPGEGQDDDHRPLPRTAGDLMAVTSALREATDDHVAILAADLTHPSSELLRYMIHVRGSFDVVAPEQRDGSLQPLLALYHTSMRRRAEGLLAAGERDLKPLLEAATIRRITVEEVAKFGDPDSLLERTGAPSI